MLPFIIIIVYKSTNSTIIKWSINLSLHRQGVQLKASENNRSDKYKYLMLPFVIVIVYKSWLILVKMLVNKLLTTS